MLMATKESEMQETTTAKAKAFAAADMPRLMEQLYRDDPNPPTDAEEVIQELLEAAYHEHEGDEEAANEEVYYRVVSAEIALYERG